MLRRFTEFMNFHGKEVCLYVRREDDDQGCFHFNVSVIDGTTSEVVLCKKTNNTWQNITQNVPGWVKEMVPVIVAMIDRKMNFQSSRHA
ncbi:MAG: hypothetical protein INR73_18005 [Williamsia sp.]|nr:hypothetical protein [Williamsia sp.]